MTNLEYNSLSAHLTNIAPRIPIRWGRIQNDDTDAEINMFQYHTFEDLELALNGLHTDTKDYFKKRWFLWKCAQCDEYLFYRHQDVRSNPNFRDQEWDFEFFGNENLRFDLKGTIIPRAIKDRMIDEYPDSLEVITFYYEQQSRGVRNNFQNRLFVIHRPHMWQKENLLRANFEAKMNAYDAYVEMLRQNPNHRFIEYRGQKAEIIYLYENAIGEITYTFASFN